MRVHTFIRLSAVISIAAFIAFLLVLTLDAPRASASPVIGTVYRSGPQVSHTYWQKQHREATAAKGRAAFRLNRCREANRQLASVKAPERCPTKPKLKSYRVWRDRAHTTSSQLAAVERRRIAALPVWMRWTPTPSERTWLTITGRCESHNDYGIHTGNGFTGAHQWLGSTWRSMGGSTWEAYQASPQEQDYRAILLRRQQGPSPWPHCAAW